MVRVDHYGTSMRPGTRLTRKRANLEIDLRGVAPNGSSKLALFSCTRVAVQERTLPHKLALITFSIMNVFLEEGWDLTPIPYPPDPDHLVELVVHG